MKKGSVRASGIITIIFSIIFIVFAFLFIGNALQLSFVQNIISQGVISTIFFVGQFIFISPLIYLLSVLGVESNSTIVLIISIVFAVFSLLMFFWGIQLAFIVAAIQLLLDIVNIENTNLYTKTRELKIILLTSISFLIYILIVIQTISLLKKDGKINSYLYHIVYLEYYLNMNIHSVFIVQDKKYINNCKNYKTGIYNSLGFISIFWEVICSFGFLLYNKIDIIEIFQSQHKFHFNFLYIRV